MRSGKRATSSVIMSGVIVTPELRRIARERLTDAEALFRAKRFDGSIYLCGYAVEIALKYRVCKTLGWIEYPETTNEFRSYRSFQTHDLDVLSHLSGREARVKTKMLAEWSTVATWDTGARYKSVGAASKDAAELMIRATTSLLKAL